MDTELSRQADDSNHTDECDEHTASLATEIVQAVYLEFSMRAEAYGDLLARDSIFARYLADQITATQAFNMLNNQGLLGTDDELLKIVIAGIRALGAERMDFVAKLPEEPFPPLLSLPEPFYALSGEPHAQT